MTAFLPRGARWLEIGAILALFLVIHVTANETDLATSADCYYNYNHYSEGDRILTNEPCLNCTCHNKMLMCYLKVCPFTKPIGQDCTIEKREDQCCPIITCPEVPVELDHSSAQSTDLATHQNHGCSIDDEFYPEGAQIPGNPKKPCELCYCIRNMTSCVMQECTLHVDGCRPIYNKGVCCPVRYDCAQDEDMPPMLEDQTTTEAPSQGFVITTTSAPIQSTDCMHNGVRYIDGELIDTEQACEHCYCMRGDIVCAVQECKPLEMHGKNCTARAPGPNECCPQLYECESDMQTPSLSDEIDLTTLGYKDDAAEPILTTEHVEKEALTTEGSAIDTSSQRIDESENEIHDKDYDHMTAKPSRSNFTAQQSPAAVDDRIEAGDSTTLLSKLEDVAATTILAESDEEKITTALPIVAQSIADEKEATESKGILDNLYTTIKSIVEFTTTLSPLSEQPQKQHDEEELFSNVIPGEGDCLDNGVSFANNTNVPTRSVCEESCLCYNSIVRCEKVKCAPMPPNAENCKVLQEEGLCCPSYHCESMEFSTGTAPTHPAENQVRDEEQHVDTTTLAQTSNDEEEQTNAIDNKLDSTTAQSESELPKETDAPAIESSTAAKEHDETESHIHHLGVQRVQTKQPTEESIVTEAATVQFEGESTTLSGAIEQEEQKVHIPEEQPEIPFETTEKVADEPQEIATTALPLEDEQETTNLPEEKVKDEIPALTHTEEIDSTTQAQTEESAPTTQKVQLDEEISTEGHKDSEVSSESVKESEISTEAQKEAEPMEEVHDDITTEGQKVSQDAEISTEAQKEAEPVEQVHDEFITTEASGQKVQQDAEISTESYQEPEISTESELKPIESQPEIVNRDEIVTTEGALVQDVQSPEQPQAPEIHDEFITTEKSEQPQEILSNEQQPEEPLSQTTLASVDGDSKLADEHKEEMAQTTSAPQLNIQEAEITERLPEYNEVSSEHIPLEIEDHKTEKDILAPATESQSEDELTPTTQKVQQDEEISTEGHKDSEVSSESVKESEIATESQKEAEPMEEVHDEFVTTEGQKVSQEAEISTESQKAAEPVEQVHDEYVTTEGQKVSQEAEISTEAQKEAEPMEEVHDESVTTEGQKVSQDAEISTESQKAAEPVEQVHDEFITTEASGQKVQQDAEISTESHQEPEISTEPELKPIESQPEIVNRDEIVTTEGALVQDVQSPEQPQAPEIHDEFITTEKSEVPQEILSNEQQPEEPLSQTTLASVEGDSKLADEHKEEMAQTTSAPQLNIQEAEITERLPEYNEVSSEQIPLEIEDHKTEKDILAPATESEQTVTEHSQPEAIAHDDEIVTEGAIASSSTDGPVDSMKMEEFKPESMAPAAQSTEQSVESGSITEEAIKQEEVSSTEHIPEEQTTLATSKLTLDGIKPDDFKDGEVVSQDEKQELDVIESEATTTGKLPEEMQSATELTESDQKPEEQTEAAKESSIAEQPAAPSHDEQITDAPLVTDDVEVSSTEKQAESESTQSVTSKQEDLEIITEKVVPSKQEDLEIVTSKQEEATTAAYSESSPTELNSYPEHHDIGAMDVTETKLAAEPSTEASIESEATTLGKIDEALPQKPLFDEFLEEQHIPPAATEKQHIEQATASIEQSEQTTFGVMSEPSTEGSEIKQDEPIPTTETPAQRPELETGNQMHIDDEEQPASSESSVTTEAAKQEEMPVTTAVHITPAEETVSQTGEEKQQEVTEKAEEPQQAEVSEIAVASSESPKEEEQPIVELATTEQTIVDVTTLLNKIHDQAAATTVSSVTEEISTHRQEDVSAQTEKVELPEVPQQQTEQPQEHEQPESTDAPVQHDEKPDSQPIDESNISTEQPAVPAESESTTLGVEQPAQSDETLEASTAAPIVEEQPLDHVNRIHEIPAEVTTEQQQFDESTQAIESSSVHVPSEEAVPAQEAQTTQAPILAEDHTVLQHEVEQPHEAATQKDELIEEQPTESTASQSPAESHENAPIVPETTANEQEAATTSEPIKSEEPLSVSHVELPSVSHDEQPIAEVTTEQQIVAQDDDQSSTKPSILDVTTIKSVVELITTLHPMTQQESEAATTTPAAEQPIVNRVDAEGTPAPELEYQTTESAHIADNKTHDEAVPVYSSPPESANNIPLIREPSLHPEHFNELTTKLAESFDTTTLPSILLTSSHTERISDSTTIKNTQNEITESTQQQYSEGSLPEQHHDAQHQPPSYPSQFDSGYGNVPSQYPDEEYTDEDEPTVFGPGTCRYGGKLYVSAQQIPRDDPCDFCFCFRSDIICLQQSCPPPITGCHEEPIQGFCCPRYECPVSMGLVLNTTTTTTTTLPPYLSHFRNSNKVTRSGCQIQGITYKIGERVTTASGPCIDCICGGDGQMKCDPKVCTPEPMLRQMIASAKRR